MDAAAQAEDVGGAVVAKLGHGFGEVGHEFGAGFAGDVAEGEQAILGEEEKLPELLFIVDHRIDRAGGLHGGEVKDAAAVGMHQGGAVLRL